MTRAAAPARTRRAPGAAVHGCMLRRMPVDLHSSPPKASADPSQAWKAAEAEFRQPPHDPASSGGARVVVKRKRTLDPGGEGGAENGPELAEEARAPRVFRVDQVPGQPAAEQTASDTEEGGSGDEAPSDGDTSAAPRRRVRKHGEVTITRPGPPDFGDLKRRALADLDAIRAEIRRLERQAEALRKAEAAEAVRWIRKEIAAYGFKASDLGL